MFNLCLLTTMSCPSPATETTAPARARSPSLRQHAQFHYTVKACLDSFACPHECDWLQRKALECGFHVWSECSPMSRHIQP